MSERTTPCTPGCLHPICAALRQQQTVTLASRDHRQHDVLRWVGETFGEATLTIEERITRFAEESIELAQAAGMDRERILALVERVYSKPAGEPRQEVGGVSVTLLAFCELAGISAEGEELREWERVQAIPVEHFRKRQNAKADAGLALRSPDSD
jgi:NTP pyrophosphatase (non-canonical NTP hydrolase)